MTLLNANDAIPPQLWAVIRLVATSPRPVSLDTAKALLQPPTLLPDGKQDKTFDTAFSALRQLGLAAKSDNGDLVLTGRAAELTGDDFGQFRHVLRTAVLDASLNTDLAEKPTAGPRDLTSVLAAFLVRDPMEPPVTWRNIESTSGAVFDANATDPTPNDTRWNSFGHWAPVLGLAAAPLISTPGKSPLVPDCSFAVRQTTCSLWKKGETVSAHELLRALRAEIPVLPGGAYSMALQLPDPGGASADPALSFALLRGEYDGWIRLDRNADARSAITLVDRDRPNRRVTDVVIVGDDLG